MIIRGRRPWRCVYISIGTGVNVALGVQVYKMYVLIFFSGKTLLFKPLIDDFAAPFRPQVVYKTRRNLCINDIEMECIAARRRVIGKNETGTPRRND